MNEIWTWITENFNNRELAVAIWLSVLFLIISFKTDIRHSIFNVVKALLNYNLLILVSAFAVNVAILSWLGTYLKIWEIILITPTVVWYFIGGLPLLGRSFDAKEGSRHFVGYAKDALSGMVFLEFIFVANTFSLLIEFILTPIIGLIAMLMAISERKHEHARLNTFLTFAMAGIAIVVFWNSINGIMVHSGIFFTTSTFKSFILPIYFTIASIPFFYLTHCYSEFEGAQIQINLKTFQTDELKSYAKKRFFLSFFLHPWLLRRATRQFHILPAKTQNDIDQIIWDIRKHERQAKNPPEIDGNKGWSPYKACEFLADSGLHTGDYHYGYGGEEWWANSAPLDLDQELLANTISYYAEGVEGLVTVLKLKGHFLDEFNPSDAISKFLVISLTLLEKAAPRQATALAAKLTQGEDFSHVDGTILISLRRERFPSEKGFNLTFYISKNGTV